MSIILPATRCSLWKPWIPRQIAVTVEFSCSGLRLNALTNSRKAATTEVVTIEIALPISQVTWYLSVQYVIRLVGAVELNTYLVFIVALANWEMGDFLDIGHTYFTFLEKAGRNGTCSRR